MVKPTSSWHPHLVPKPDAPAPQALKTLPFDTDTSLRDKVMRSIKAPYRPVLVVLVGNEAGTRVVLEGTVVVGRNPANHLTLTDAGVSWHHARVEDRGDAWAVVDLDSTNGTLVNDRRIAEYVLHPGDKITFGRTVVRFDVQDAYDQAYDVVVERMMNIDDLSGLLVRRKFDAELQAMLSTARVRGEPVGLLVMDLDGIKSINDTHGHLFGAYTIGEAGNLIGRVIAGSGIGSRFGGDEFLVALPGADLAATSAMGERILRAIAEHRFEREGIVLRPGISIGAASFPAQAGDALGLFQAADEAMYRAKHTGKNRVCT
jgi:two-component system cell cycle response regulator